MSAVNFLDLFVGSMFLSLIACVIYAITFLRDGEDALTPDEMRDEAEDFVRRCVVGIECTDAEISRAALAAYEAFTWRIDAIRLSGGEARQRDRRSRGRPAMNFPTSPIEQHNRLIGSFCDDLLNRDREYPRSKVVALIVRKIREEGCAIAASGTVAGAPAGLSRCASQAKPLIDYRKEGEQ